MATAKALPVQIELRQTDYLVLLKHAKNRSRVAARLMAAVEDDRIGRKGFYVFTGFVTDALGLRAVALIHAPKALPAIERGLKRAQETWPMKLITMDRAKIATVECLGIGAQNGGTTWYSADPYHGPVPPWT